MFNTRTACNAAHVKLVLWLLNMLQHVLGNSLQFNSRARLVVNKETPPHWNQRSQPKKAVAMAKRCANENLYARLETKGEELYRLARQRDRAGKDVQHVRVIKDENANVMINSEAVLKRWRSTLKN